jgi:hypothetical protein
MQVHVDANSTKLTALLDFGSTHNFVDADVVACIGLSLHGCSGLCVVVPNDDHISSLGCC